MESILAASLDSELAIALLFSSGIFLGLSFLIVLAVRSVPNKLLLLGLLVTITAVVFAAILPSAGKLIWALLIPAVTLILIGALCLAIGFVAQLVKSGNAGSKKSSDQGAVEQK
jgi:galactitol-specific phosphotransferase system IIC component